MKVVGYHLGGLMGPYWSLERARLGFYRGKNVATCLHFFSKSGLSAFVLIFLVFMFPVYIGMKFV